MSDLEDLPGQLVELRTLIKAAHEARQDVEGLLRRQKAEQKEFEKNLLGQLVDAHNKAEKKIGAMIAQMGKKEREEITNVLRAGQVPTFAETGDMISIAVVQASKIESEAMVKLHETMTEKFSGVYESLHVVSEHQATYGKGYEKLERTIKAVQGRLDKLIASLGGDC